MLITILGPDGCGKTTIANGIVNRHQELGFDTASHHATNFGLLPTFGEIKAKIYALFGKTHSNKHSHEEGEYLSGMRHKPNSMFKSVVLACWYGLDYSLGHGLVSEAKKSKELMVFARYFYDFYYQRVHLNLPSFFIRAIEFIVPSPDLIIFLKRDSEVIFKMKPELSKDEIDRQNFIIESKLSGRSNFVIINSEENIQDTIDKVLLVIRERYEV